VADEGHGTSSDSTAEAAGAAPGDGGASGASSTSRCHEEQLAGLAKVGVVLEERLVGPQDIE